MDVVCCFGSKNLQSIVYVSTNASNSYLHLAKAPTPDGTVWVIHMLGNPGSSRIVMVSVQWPWIQTVSVKHCRLRDIFFEPGFHLSVIFLISFQKFIFLCKLMLVSDELDQEPDTFFPVYKKIYIILICILYIPYIITILFTCNICKYIHLYIFCTCVCTCVCVQKEILMLKNYIPKEDSNTSN